MAIIGKEVNKYHHVTRLQRCYSKSLTEQTHDAQARYCDTS